MNFFMYLETQFVERQKALAVSPESVTPENQAKFNAVMENIQQGRKLYQKMYQVRLIVHYILILLRIAKPPVFQSSIPPKPASPPDLKVVA